MTVQAKLKQVAAVTGFPFAINAAGYDSTTDNYKGIQAWSCQPDAEADAGASIYCFNEQYDIDSWPQLSDLYDTVELSEFYQLEDGECIYFQQA